MNLLLALLALLVNIRITRITIIIGNTVVLPVLIVSSENLKSMS